MKRTNIKIMGYNMGVNYGDLISKDSDETVQVATYFGYFESIEQKISINDTVSTTQQISTMLHEIIEAINFMFDLNLPHQTISTLETSLFTTLSENGVNLRPLLYIKK